jgi:hypothetical protein
MAEESCKKTARSTSWGGTLHRQPRWCYMPFRARITRRMVSHRALIACAVLVGSVAPLACVSSSAPTTHCRAGQHDAGSGSCVVDDALTVPNRSGTDYWRCVESVGNVRFTYKLAFVDQGAVTSGSGSVRYMNDGPPDDYPSDSTEATTYTFSWYEGRPTTLAWPNSVDVSQNPWPRSSTLSQRSTQRGRRRGSRRALLASVWFSRR